MVKNNDPRHVSLQRLTDILLEANALANEKDANGVNFYSDSGSEQSFQGCLIEALRWIEYFERGGR